MNSDERAFNKILKAAGVILIAMGLLAVWRGVFRLMPFFDFRYGLIFSLMGGLFGLIGVIFVVMTVRKEKKWDKALAELAQADGTDRAGDREDAE